MINRESVTLEIKRLAGQYIEQSLAVSEYEINNGLCEDFAYEIVRLFSDLDKNTEIFDFSLENFMTGKDGDSYKNDIFDKELISKHWKNVVPTEGLTWDDMESIHFGHHVWICYDGVHYDAECPEGVENFFELPLFQKYIQHYKSKKQNMNC